MSPSHLASVLHMKPFGKVGKNLIEVCVKQKQLLELGQSWTQVPVILLLRPQGKRKPILTEAAPLVACILLVAFSNDIFGL